MNKKIKYITTLSAVAVATLLSSATVLAANGEVYDLSTKTVKYTTKDLANLKNQLDAGLNSEKYGYERDGKVFNLTDVNAVYVAEKKAGNNDLTSILTKVTTTVKEAFPANADLTVSSVSAINETAIQVTGLAKEVKEADLVGNKIVLKAGDVSLTATYVATSLTEDGKANFVLEAEKKLTDAVTYTVTSDKLSFTTNTFMAKGLVAPYVNKVEVLTKAIPANIAASGKNLVNFTAKNQYGEVIPLVGNVANVKVTGTLNGVPFLADELADKTNLANGVVEVNKDLKEGDKVTLSLTNTIGLKTGVEVGTVSYTVAKAEVAVATTVSDMTAKYADALNPNGHTNATEAKEVLPGDSVKLTVKVNDQFGNPIDGQLVRWVVEEGKDVITGNVAGGDGSFPAITEVSDAADFTFRAAKAGKVKVSAYNTANGAKVTYEVTVGAQALNGLKLVDEGGTRFNLDENIVKVVTPNAGANLTADQIKFDVKAVKTSVDVTAADVQVSAKVRGGDKDNKNDMVIVAKSTKPGKFTVTPYVGTSLDDAKTIKGTAFDVTTTIDQAVTSMDDIAFDATELKAGVTIKKDVTFRNKNKEVVVVAAPAVTVVTPLNQVVATVTKDITDAKNPKNILTILGATKGNCTVAISEGSMFKSYSLTLTEPTFTKVDAGADITGVVAGDANTKAKDQAIKLLDQDGKEMNVKASDLTLTVTKPDGQALANVGDLVKLAAVYGFDKDAKDLFDEATGVEIVKGFRVQPSQALAQGVYTVKIANADGSKIADTFTVTVGAARVAKTVEVTPVSTSVALNGAVKVKVTPKDQYGEFIAVTAANIAVTPGANFATSAVTEINKDGGVVDGTHLVAAYEVTLTGNTKGTNDVVVNVMDKVGADAKILSTNKVSMTVDAVSNLVASVAVDTTDIKAVNSTLEADPTDIQLKAIAKDANGAVVPVSNNDLSWTIKSVTGKVGAVGHEVDATAGTVGLVGLNTGLYAPVQNFKGTVTIEVRTANMKVGEVTLNLDPAKATAKTGTTKVVNNTADKIVDADATKDGIQVALDGVGDEDAEANGAIVLKLSAVNQYGTPIDTVDIDGNNVIMMADDASVLKAEKNDVNDTITLTAKSVGTANVYVQYNGDTIKLEVAVNDAAVKAATKASIKTGLEAIANDQISVAVNNGTNVIDVTAKTLKADVAIGSVTASFDKDITISNIVAYKGSNVADISAYLTGKTLTGKTLTNVFDSSVNQLLQVADKVTLDINGISYTVNLKAQ